MDAMSCLDRNQLSWRHLPSIGGYYDQDFMIMEIWETVRNEYIKCLGDEKFMKIIKK